MIILSVFRADLRITSKQTAMEFYKGVKSVILIPFDGCQMLRIEPDCHISLIPKESIKDGSALFFPSYRDEDGTFAYGWRKYINAYLRKE